MRLSINDMNRIKKILIIVIIILIALLLIIRITALGEEELPGKRFDMQSKIALGLLIGTIVLLYIYVRFEYLIPIIKTRLRIFGIVRRRKN